MIFYGIAILLSMILITVVNIIFNGYNLSILYIILAVVISTIAVIGIDGFFAFFIRRFLPEKWFTSTKKFFNVSKREERFYTKLKIKIWKDKVPELGGFTNFHKNKIYDGTNNEYVEQFLIESNYGEIIHITGIFVGFLIIFLYPLKYFYMFGLPVAFVNAILNILPTFILRYNTPKLMMLKLRNEKYNTNIKQD